MSAVRNAGSLQIAVAPEAVKTFNGRDAEHRVPTAPRQASPVAACPCLVSATITLLLLLLVVQASSGQVPYERIRRAESEPGNWLTYSGNYQSHRHSLLAQINPGNVARLKPAWVYQIRNAGEVQTC